MSVETLEALGEEAGEAFDWARSGPAARVMSALESARAGASRYVGGCVRDALVGAAPKDVDIATELEPQETIAALEAARLGAAPTGLAHGTITAIADHVGVEVTTLRADVSTDGRRASVAFTKDWRTDALRRDFTINALYLTPDLRLYDPVGGRADLLARRVAFIGAPEDRIREDFLRILRFFRFSARFAFAHDAPGLAACGALRHGLKSLSAERVGEEMIRILTLPRASFAVSAMAATGVLAEVWPERADLSLLSTLKRMAPDADPALGLAALWGENADGMDARLRLSGARAHRRKAAIAVAAHLPPNVSHRAARAALYRFGREAYGDGLLLACAREGVAPAQDLRAIPDADPPPLLPFSGKDIVAAGVAPGPRVSEILKEFETAWIEADFPDEARAKTLLAAVIAKALA